MRRASSALIFLCALSACSSEPPAATTSAAPTASAAATGAEAPAPSASAAASASTAASSDALADLSGSAPLPEPPPPRPAPISSAEVERRAKLVAELDQLDMKMLDTLSTPSARVPTADLLAGPGDISMLDSMARGSGGVPGGLSTGGGGGSLRAGTGGGGGLAAIGDSGGGGVRVAKIGGKPLEDAGVDELEKAITTAGCSSTRDADKAPLLVLPTTCDQRRFTVTLVPKGTKLEPAKRDALTKDAAVLEQGGAILVVHPEPPADLAAANGLLGKLRREPTATASLGGAAVAGGSVSNGAAVVAGMAAGFRRCFNRGLQENPSMSGSLKLVLTLGPNGEVTKTESTGGAGLSDAVIACAKARASAAQFAAPEGAGPTTITIPLTFTTQ